jgi:predicted HicB family RNase H-like nuclease
MARPKTDLVKITLRLPPPVHADVTAQAVENGRSLNAEIVQQLRRGSEGYRKL